MALVEMGVQLDEGGKHDAAGEVELRAVVGRTASKPAMRPPSTPIDGEDEAVRIGRPRQSLSEAGGQRAHWR